jgi:tetratricopeptide (TPR) repeat protein
MTRARHAATLFAAVAHVVYAIVDRIADPLARHLLHDAARYDAWARAIVAGRAFEAGAFSQAPLYPYALAALYAACGPHPVAMIAVQVVLGVATVVLVGSAAARAFGEEAGAWAAWLMAGYGTLAFFETKLLPASLVVFLVALFVAAAQRADAARRATPWLAAGAAAGLLIDGHAASLLVLAGAAVWIASDRARPPGQRAARVALCVAAAGIVLLPVAAHNRIVGGSPALVADNAGVTFWQGNNPHAAGVYSTPEGFTGAIASQREESIRGAEAEEGRSLSGAEVSRHWLARGLRFLGRKALFAIASTEQPLEYSPRLDSNPVRYLFPIPFAAVLALAAVGLPSALRQRAAHPALLIAGATLLTLLAFYVASRYRLPAIPGLAILGGAGGALLRERMARRKNAMVPLACFALVFLVSVSWFPMTQSSLARTQDAMTLSDLGTAERETGRLDEAVATYRRAIALDPSAPYPHLDLGKALTRAGRPAEALAETEDAVRLGPGISEAHFDLGVLRFRSGQFAAAADAFREAFRLDPGSAEAGNNLAGTYVRLGRIDEARAVVRTLRADGLPVDPELASLGGP